MYRTNNFQSSYDPNQKLGYSNISRGMGQSVRNPIEDHGLGQVEFMLENQRRKFKESKDKLEHDLDNERKLRIQFQNKLIKLKDEFSRKDVILSELQFKINNLLHQNQDLASDNDRLKHQLGRLEQLYGGKIQELETQLSLQARNFQETTLQYNAQFEKFKKQGQDYVEQLTFEFERKIKNLQDKVKGTEMNRKDLAMENKKLNDILISNKLNFEEEIRDLKNKARDEEIKRTQQLNRSFEQKVKMVEEGKEMLLRKNQELLRALQEKERELGELQGDRSEQITKLRQECGDLHQHNNQLTYLLSKCKQELADKDLLIDRSHNDNGAELMNLKQQLQAKKNENAQLAASMRQLRGGFKQAESEWERRKRELLDRNSNLETQARRYKDQYIRICDVLKSKINSTIDNVSFKK